MPKIKLQNILFRKSESFSENDEKIKIHFLYSGEEYLFYYNNNKKNSTKDILIFDEETNEVVYRKYIDNKEKKKCSQFNQTFDESFLESLKNSRLCKFFDFEFIDLVRFYDDWN